MRWLLSSDKIVIEEHKVRELLDTQLVSIGGLVESYTLTSGTFKAHMETPGREDVSEFIIGPGHSHAKHAIHMPQFTGIEPNFLDAMDNSVAFYPRDIVS